MKIHIEFDDEKGYCKAVMADREIPTLGLIGLLGMAVTMLSTAKEQSKIIQPKGGIVKPQFKDNGGK